MKIPVNPQWRPRPCGRGNGTLPQIEYGDLVDESVELPEVFPHSLCASRKGNTPPRVVWSVGRCGLVERAKEPLEGDDHGRKVVGWRTAAHFRQ